MMPTASYDCEGHKRGRPAVSAHITLLVLGLLGLMIAGGAVVWGSEAVAPAPNTPADSIEAAPDTTALRHRVVAYYFHTTRRCASCEKLEAYTREAIEMGFPKALKEERLVWRVVNVEEKGNEHFVKDFQLFTKAVILVEEGDSTQVRWKNLPKVWELLGDKAGFLRYVQGETRGYLTERQ